MFRIYFTNYNLLNKKLIYMLADCNMSWIEIIRINVIYNFFQVLLRRIYTWSGEVFKQSSHLTLRDKITKDLSRKVKWLSYFQGFFLKENVRYPVWTCRDPMFSDSVDPMIILSDSRDPIFNSRDPNRVP